MLIRRNKVRRTKERTISDYERIKKKPTGVIWKYEKDLIKLNEFNKKKKSTLNVKK